MSCLLLLLMARDSSVDETETYDSVLNTSIALSKFMVLKLKYIQNVYKTLHTWCVVRTGNSQTRPRPHYVPRLYKKHGHFAHAQLISCRFWFYRQWIFDFNNNAEEAKYGISYHILILHESTNIKVSLLFSRDQNFAKFHRYQSETN